MFLRRSAFDRCFHILAVSISSCRSCSVRELSRIATRPLAFASSSVCQPRLTAQSLLRAGSAATTEHSHPGKGRASSQNSQLIPRATEMGKQIQAIQSRNAAMRGGRIFEKSRRSILARPPRQQWDKGYYHISFQKREAPPEGGAGRARSG